MGLRPSLARKAYEEGFRFRKSRNKVPVATLHKILRKRIYTGDFDYAGVTYQGSHDPLVAREVWNGVQDILDGRQNRNLRKTRHKFAYSGIVRCGHCCCALVGEVKKGRYVYYHCTGYRGKCGEPYTREETLTQQFAGGLRELILSPAILQWLTTELLQSEEAERLGRAQVFRRDQAELERAQARLEMMYGDRLDGRIDADTYDKMAKEVREQQLGIQERMRRAEPTRLPPMSRAVDLLVCMSKAAQEFTEFSRERQRKFLQLVLKEASGKGGELRKSFQEPFEKLRLSNSASTTNHKSLDLEKVDFDNWRATVDAFRTFLANDNPSAPDRTYAIIF